VYKFVEQNQNIIENIDGNFKNEGVITVYEDGDLKYYKIQNGIVLGV
jgi:hypothetical protein